MANRDDGISYEYRGSIFLMREHMGYYGWKRDGYEIAGIIKAGEALHLPDNFKGEPVTHWVMEDGGRFLAVRRLYIPAGIISIDIPCRLFPQLEEVEVQKGNKTFSTDGKMVLSLEGTAVISGLAAGNQEILIIPKAIGEISGKAFVNAACREVIFENPGIYVAEGAFDGSGWMEDADDFKLTGSTFYCLRRSLDILEVPKQVKGFHEKAFQSHAPAHLSTHIMPAKRMLIELYGSGYGHPHAKELTVTGTGVPISLKTLSGLPLLESVNLPDGHRKYCSVDGVIFSNDRKTLVFYPRGRTKERYEIPEGTVKIAKDAFSGQNYLKDIYMPDTVQKIGISAFYACRYLKTIRLSDHIQEIPDASAYQNMGVFEKCESLSEVRLPAKLQYLGRRAFYGSGLKKITLNGQLGQIGEYALAECSLSEIALPASLERLGHGALACIPEISAYAGTAKGLVSAVNTSPLDITEKRANVEWVRCFVHVLQKGGGAYQPFIIPGSLKRSAAHHLDMAWNNDQIDYEEYDECFASITDSDERVEFAKSAIRRIEESGEGDSSAFVAYMRRMAGKIGERLLEDGREEAFLELLENGYLSDTAIKKMLKLANKKGLTSCAAYLLKYQDEHGHSKQRRFAL